MVASGAHSPRRPHEVRPLWLEQSTTIAHPKSKENLAHDRWLL
jgi:hypothetical protein